MSSARPRTAAEQLHSGGGSMSTGWLVKDPLLSSGRGPGYEVYCVLGILWDKRYRTRRMDSIQFHGGQNRGCLHWLGFCALGGRGHWQQSFVDAGGWGTFLWLLWVALSPDTQKHCYRITALLPEAYSIPLKDIFCAPLGEGRVLPGGRTVGTTQLEE